MELDPIFQALADATRRRLIEDLAERDGQSLFELHVRLITCHGQSLSRQALSRHLAVLENAGLIRHEWQWKSKHHYLVRAPLLRLSKIWLNPLLHEPEQKKENKNADRRDEHIGG